MAIDSCGICGGDGRIANAFGNHTRCPSCHGTGRRSDEGGMRDVTKTKPSHHRPATSKAAADKPEGPSTSAGLELVNQMRASGHVSSELEKKLTREIMDYEASHGKCTETFIKKIKKQIRPVAR